MIHRVFCVFAKNNSIELFVMQTFPFTTIPITTTILTDTITTTTTLTILSPPPSLSWPQQPSSSLPSFLPSSSYKIQKTYTIFSSVGNTVKRHPSTNCKWHQHILPWILGTRLSHFVSSTFGGRLTVFFLFVLDKTFSTIYKQPHYWMLREFLQFIFLEKNYCYLETCLGIGFMKTLFTFVGRFLYCSSFIKTLF